VSWYTYFKLQPKSSIHTEVINIFVDPRWRPPPSWIFKISQFFNNYRMYLAFLHFLVQFGDNRSTYAKMTWIFSKFSIALKMPNQAPFWARFGVKHPRISKILNSDPQTRRLSVFARKSANRYSRGAIPRNKKKEKLEDYFGKTKVWSRGS